jgi:CDP-paratose 2-epimerase
MPVGMETVLITGGAGFIGANLAAALLRKGSRVRIFDNFSRNGVRRNLDWLRTIAPAGKLEIVRGDVRNMLAVREATRDAEAIYHLAAQVAVTTSIDEPVTDFEVNARGTLNVLEAARGSGHMPFLLLTSTNKVYGALSDLETIRRGDRYVPADPDFRGVSEQRSLDFHSPYGCSKGTADQYVRDYGRIYGLNTVVFRMSCIAGPRQFGNEDQGWVAHFLYSAREGKPITVCGDGYQVRDVLHVHDLTDAMMIVRNRSRAVGGEVYNMGGGMERAVSVVEMLRECERRAGRPLVLKHAETRAGDQPFYVSDTRKLQRHVDWRPRRSLEDVLDSIEGFWKENHEVIGSRYAGLTLEPPRVQAEEVA